MYAEWHMLNLEQKQFKNRKRESDWVKVWSPLKSLKEKLGREGKKPFETEAEDDDFNIRCGVVKNMVVGQGK